MYKTILLALVALLAASCSTRKQESSNGKEVNDAFHYTPVSMLPQVQIYKTKQDYSRQVPILLNEAKDEIVSYPHPTDLCPGGYCAYPTPLADGFWLDNRGIGASVAFLSYTYEEYAALASPPSQKQLMEAIVDSDPLTELYQCGSVASFTDLVEELNTLIKAGGYSQFPNRAGGAE
ncbi:hypothetical protein LJC35_02395 [Parabacteroides sp. OttesenSCG-928-N08]|nr:hypothetical protein [Parabacteroides sp. OttesenSCG-928-N08]